MFHPSGPTFWELAEQALSSTRRGYELLAPKFDYTPFRTPDAILKPAIDRLAALSPINDALDICCGTGAAMQHLRPHCHRRIVGLDMSPTMMEVAARNLSETPSRAAIDFVEADALDMPFREEFDLAVCFGAHGHILPCDEARFVAQVHKVLRPGGRFGFATTQLPPVWSLRRWLARGFNAVMHVRNALIRPPFIMFYLTFLLPGAQRLCEEQGFQVEVIDDCYEGRLKPLKLVVATKLESPT
jgi:SAM-dependent methyltransferase